LPKVRTERSGPVWDGQQWRQNDTRTLGEVCGTEQERLASSAHDGLPAKLHSGQYPRIIRDQDVAMPRSLYGESWGERIRVAIPEADFPED
jgi:hypothetical protein